LILLILISLYSTGCELLLLGGNKEKDKIQYYFDDPTLFETDYFDCIEYRGDIAICRLTKMGYEVKELIVPEKINGKYVGYLGDPYGNPEYSPLSFRKELQKLFINTRDLKSISLDFEVSETHTPKIIVMRDTSSYSKLKEKHKETVKLYLGPSLMIHMWFLEGLIPNIGYFIKVENKQMGTEDFYWSDDIEIGERINTLPPIPEREGYIFDGWYSDLEFINKWDFEEDMPFPTLEEYIYNEDGPDFALFGRWIDEGENL
jgi:hypothetical protein